MRNEEVIYPDLAAESAISNQQSAINQNVLDGIIRFSPSVAAFAFSTFFQKETGMRDFRQIKVWSKAHLLTLEIYKVTATFPQQERYGLTSQLRRSSPSVVSNIAEGFGRGGNTELARFLQTGMGSATEVEYQILLARPCTYTTRYLCANRRARRRSKKNA